MASAHGCSVNIIITLTIMAVTLITGQRDPCVVIKKVETM